MDKRYSHEEYEDKIYHLWEKSGGFGPNDDAEAEPYCVIMPPPNANDPLHVGHACFVTIEDIMIRVARMQGKAALWLPGTDHAGIETQYVFEKKLVKKGKSRFDFDREMLFSMIWDYVQENSEVALGQMKKLGASADWSRTRFTLEPEIVEQVVETFEQMHKEGLVYRDLRLVNYCTKCGTGFSELEVKHEKRKDPLYYVKYEVVGGGKAVVVATVRPETIFADVAIAIHPKHKRAKELAGKKVINPLTRTEMPVITDEAVDPEFGTGMLKITPFHDVNDWEIWQRHKEQMVEPMSVVGFDGKMVNVGQRYERLAVVAAREESIKELNELGAVERVDEGYVHNVGRCYRCGRVIEPLPRPQFFIRVEPLVTKTLEALDEGKTKVVGAGHDKILRHWLENLKDWNISRQIVWGIRLPIWYSISTKHQASNIKQAPNANGQNSNLEIEVVFLNKKQEKVVGRLGELLEEYELEEIWAGLQSLQAPIGAKFVVSPTSPGDDYIQETDTFDTWFSSSQWPYVTLKVKKNDFEKYYPTSVMETAYDILMFWVMRMLMMGLYKTGEVPFETVYLHGLIRDEKGQKMSKSKGNAVNPLDVVEKYGADALRMALVIRSSAGLDKNVGEQDFRAMRNLTNKIWNSARYILLRIINDQAPNSRQIPTSKHQRPKQGDGFEKKLNKIASNVTKQLAGHRYGMAAETVYNEFWHWFCDECIEQNKQSELSDEELMVGLVTFLKLLHPFVPFVTEAVYQELKKNEDATALAREMLSADELMNSEWPSGD